jgi:hypothetical protein
MAGILTGIDFCSIEYLRTGSQKQTEVFALLSDSGIMETLAEFTPVLAGTIPIGIDTDESDLDILCCWSDKLRFQKTLRTLSAFDGFRMHEKVIRGFETVIVRFMLDRFPVEVFGQNRPVFRQEAYRHMIAEYLILQEKGEEFRQKVVELKKKGIKTEPAFGKLMGLRNDPYEALLVYFDRLSS